MHTECFKTLKRQRSRVLIKKMSCIYLPIPPACSHLLLTIWNVLLLLCFLNITRSYVSMSLVNMITYIVAKLAFCFVLNLKHDTVDSRYLEIERTLKNASKYPYFDISDL